MATTYVSARDLQDRWKCSRSTAYRAIDMPGFPRPLVIGREHRYPLHEVEGWEMRQRGDFPGIPPSKRPGRKPAGVAR